MNPGTHNGQIGVDFTLSSDGSTNGVNSRQRTSTPGPIALDGRIITTPTINTAICGGQTIITWGRTARRTRSSAPTSTTRCDRRPARSRSASRGSRPWPHARRRLLVRRSSRAASASRWCPVHDRVLPPARGAGGRSPDLLFARHLRRVPVIGVTLTLAGVAAFICRSAWRSTHNILLRSDEGRDPGRQDARPGDRGRIQPGVVEHP